MESGLNAAQRKVVVATKFTASASINGLALVELLGLKTDTEFILALIRPLHVQLTISRNDSISFCLILVRRR